MFKKICFVICTALVFASCVKSSSPVPCDPTPSTAVATTAEIAYLQNYVTVNGITAVKDTSGIFYQVINPGTGTLTANICSTVAVTYIGQFLTGSSTPFDSNTSGVSFLLGNLIQGWQKGIPKVKKGGSVNLFIPPSLAYGSDGSGSIPPNSYLKFTIQLLDVVN